MQKIRKLSNLINYPPSHLQDFELFCKAVKVTFMRAVKDHQIRWNSTFNMLHRAVYLKLAFNMFNRSKEEYINLILTNREWELAEFLLHFLSPFKITTDLLQATQKPTLHKTFEIYERLFNSIDNVRALFQNMNIKSN